MERIQNVAPLRHRMNSQRHLSLAPPPISLYGTPCPRPQIPAKRGISRPPHLRRHKKMLKPPDTACAAALSPHSKLSRNPFPPSPQPQLPPPPSLWFAR